MSGLANSHGASGFCFLFYAGVSGHVALPRDPASQRAYGGIFFFNFLFWLTRALKTPAEQTERKTANPKQVKSATKDQGVRCTVIST